MRFLFGMATFVVLLVTTTSSAHGPQLQITNDADKIVTRSILLEGPYDALTDPKSVYVMPLLPFLGQWYARPNIQLDIFGNPVYFSGPGIAYGYDQHDGGPRAFADSSIFTIDFTDGLKRWNGATFVDPGSEQIESFRGSSAAPSASATSSDAGPFASLAFDPISPTYNAEAHATARWRLLGDGSDPTSASQDGVYLVSLSIASTQVGLAPSDEYFFVLHKNTARATVLDAIDSLGVDRAAVQWVPEPSSIVLAAFGSLLFATLIRRRRLLQDRS